MDRNYDVKTSISRRPRVAIYADFIKFVTMFIKIIFKNPKKLLELEIIFQKAVYVCIS